jgi:hypothetical protein
MMNFIVRPLEEPRLREYLLDRLSMGKDFNSGLGTIVGDRSGRISLLLPDDAAFVPGVTNLEWALPVGEQQPNAQLSSIEAEDALGAIAKLAECALLDGRAGLLIVEDAVSQFSDPSEHDVSHRRLLVGETLHRVGVLDQSTGTSDCLDVCRSSENAWCWIGACVSGRWTFGAESVASIGGSEVRALAFGALVVYALAFDGDGAVVWERG